MEKESDSKYSEHQAKIENLLSPITASDMLIIEDLLDEVIRERANSLKGNFENGDISLQAKSRIWLMGNASDIATDLGLEFHYDRWFENSVENVRVHVKVLELLYNLDGKTMGASRTYLMNRKGAQIDTACYAWRPVVIANGVDDSENYYPFKTRVAAVKNADGSIVTDEFWFPEDMMDRTVSRQDAADLFDILALVHESEAAQGSVNFQATKQR